MKFYKLDDQIVIADNALTVGVELSVRIIDGTHEKYVPIITVDGDAVIN